MSDDLDGTADALVKVASVAIESMPADVARKALSDIIRRVAERDEWVGEWLEWTLAGSDTTGDVFDSIQAMGAAADRRLEDVRAAISGEAISLDVGDDLFPDHGPAMARAYLAAALDEGQVTPDARMWIQRGSPQNDESVTT